MRVETKVEEILFRKSRDSEKAIVSVRVCVRERGRKTDRHSTGTRRHIPMQNN